MSIGSQYVAVLIQNFDGINTISTISTISKADTHEKNMIFEGTTEIFFMSAYGDRIFYAPYSFGSVESVHWSGSDGFRIDNAALAGIIYEGQHQGSYELQAKYLIAATNVKSVYDWSGSTLVSYDANTGELYGTIGVIPDDIATLRFNGLSSELLGIGTSLATGAYKSQFDIFYANIDSPTTTLGRVTDTLDRSEFLLIK